MADPGAVPAHVEAPPGARVIFLPGSWRDQDQDDIVLSFHHHDSYHQDYDISPCHHDCLEAGERESSDAMEAALVAPP